MRNQSKDTHVKVKKRQGDVFRLMKRLHREADAPAGCGRCMVTLMSVLV